MADHWVGTEMEVGDWECDNWGPTTVLTQEGDSLQEDTEMLCYCCISDLSLSMELSSLTHLNQLA